MEPVLDAHKEEEIYYRTDHHWTTLGAWYAYEQYTKAVGGDLQRAQGKRSSVASVKISMEQPMQNKLCQTGRQN